MIKQIMKSIAFILFSMALFTGNYSIAWAEPFNNNVKDCINNPEKCQQDVNTKEKQQSNKGNENVQAVGLSIWDFVKMIGALIFVVALIYFLLRFVNQKSRSYQKTKLIQHIGGTPLGGNRSVQIVKVGDRLLVLGVGEDIQLLKEISDREEYERFLQQYNDQVDQMLQPQDMMSNVLKKWKSDRTNADEDQKEFKQVFEDKLSHMKLSREKAIRKMNSKENGQDE
ncbi:flagellar biosynthetic protein FliO [Bacillus sp. FJAT-42315]|uniref:flagellar biosynthetic protein FliO n=1 Tax=Bacillus sp. FJAT-42315 TaxID=2014077 RepID=UPI000C24C552|nr:flagellar biosynthetic protein FliO [Bacillus sp. FJAT-42315]